MTLPVQQILPQLDLALTEGGAAVLVAPPGSGKTTLVPLALKDTPWLDGKKILLLEPRRLAARLAAAYMSELQGEAVGETVGYQVRFDRKVSAATRVEVITEGILTRRLQNDPELTDVGLVVFDEFHERNLDSDLALAFCLDARSGLRHDLRILVMSATIDADAISTLLGNAPVIRAEGRVYPVAIRHLDPLAITDSSRPDHLAGNTVRAIRRVVAEDEGDTLVFLPGIGEIRRVEQQLSGLAGVVIRPLHSSLKTSQQEQAIRPDPQGRRRIILATTIAETSVTIEGVRLVIDCGWKRVSRFDPDSGLTRLVTVRISRASAEQRAGRAGRLGPGSCYRLWNRGIEAGLQEFDQPEIRQADPAPLVLELANWGVRDPSELSWLDLPPQGPFAQARELLIRLGGLDERGLITELGKQMARLPLHPRLARMVLLAGEKNLQLGADLAALLSERDLLRKSTSADLDLRLACLQRFRDQGISAAKGMGASPGGCKQVDRVSRQLSAILGKTIFAQGPARTIGRLLALAYPDRVARQRTGGRGSYKLVSGKGGRLEPHDPLSSSEWLVAASQEAHHRNGRIHIAASLSLDEVEELFQEEITEQTEVAWDPDSQSVRSRRFSRLGELILREQPVVEPDPAAVRAALLEGIRELGMDVLPWNRESRQVQARLACLKEWQPEVNWPELSDFALLETMETWLAPYLEGRTTLRSCRDLPLKQILLGGLDYQLQQQLERDAPTHIRVPSGSRKQLRYEPGRPPILAVRLQEMFGLADTPTVCRGRVQVILHLLSPAMRPVQVTGDLRGFWDSGYFAVRRELRGKYPKHHWPEEPWKARATARVKPKKKK